MGRYCVRTRLVEKPSVCLYYIWKEDDNTVIDALNVIVAFTPADARIFDEDAAIKLCKHLNEDKDSLLECGYTEFEAIKKANSV